MTLFAISCLLDFADDEINIGIASGIHGLALLLTGFTANLGGNVVQDGSLGHVDDVGLSKSSSDGKLVLLDDHVNSLRNMSRK
jgi:hypothetical protein